MDTVLEGVRAVFLSQPACAGACAGLGNVVCFGGPSVPKPPKEKPQPLPPAPPIPEAPKPPEPIPPAPTTSKLEVQEAEEDQRRQAAQRKGMRQTLIAGETGGYLSPTPDPTRKSLLG